MTRIRDLEGRPTRIKEGTAKRLNAALEVLGIEPVTGIGITQTDSSLKINGQTLRAVKSYTTTRAIEFDHNVCNAIRSLLDSQGYDYKSTQASYSVMRKEIEELAPDKYWLLGAITTEYLKRYTEKAQALLAYTSSPAVIECLAHNDALNILFNSTPGGSVGYSEVIME